MLTYIALGAGQYCVDVVHLHVHVQTNVSPLFDNANGAVMHA
jgi:hypothetical protein